MSKRKGVIKITNQLYDSDWEIISAIFSKFKPSHIEFRYWENDMWYFYGTSELFDELKEAEAIPFYDVIFTSQMDGTYTFEFKKA